MKAVSKKLLSLLLVAILLVSAVPFQALAAENEETETTAATEAAEAAATEAAEAEDETEAPTVAAGTEATLLLDANGGVIGTAVSQSIKVYEGKQIGTLPTPTRNGYTFKGWYSAKEGGTYFDGSEKYYADSTPSTLYAHWELNAKGVIIKAVVDGDKSSAYDIHKATVGVDELLLDYLDSVKSQISVPAGYTWDTHWYDFSTDELIAQNENFSDWRTVYVKFNAKTNLKLYFSVGEGASVDPTTKTVTYNQKVGTLPTPTKTGYVFRGWYDDSGKQYTASTVYKVNGDTTLTASWKKQATVILEIYTNGNTDEPDRCPVLTGYAVGDYVTRSDVSEVIKKYYSAKSGSSLTVQGLYGANMWQDYLEDSSTAGIESIQIHTADETIHIYVMVNNAKQGGTTSSGSSSSGSSDNNSSTDATKDADPTNPQTGDSSMIYVSMTVMLMAAAALVVVEQLRKRKMI